MNESRTSSPNSDEPTQQKNRRNASRYFWITVIALAVITILLALARHFRWTEPPNSKPIEISGTVLQKILSGAPATAKEIAESDIEEMLDIFYAPAYAAIPDYASFHYSVLGEYIELSEAVKGQMSENLHDRLFAGFEQRLSEMATLLDQRYVEAYRNILQDQVAAQLTHDGTKLPSGELTDAVLQDAVERAQTTLPVATVAAGLAAAL